MNFFEMIKQQKADRVAIIEDGVEYTYGELVEKTMEISRREDLFPEKEGLHIIRKKGILNQLLEFFASSERNLIPLIVPVDVKVEEEILRAVPVPQAAGMAVMTSGTTGVPKVLFRRYESWADFFPVQNEIFKITKESRLFVQGSLAFTGNLNLYMAQFFAGAVIIAQNDFDPKQWVRVIKEKKANAIYLIPSKLMCIPKVLKEENQEIKMILSGSQSLGVSEAEKLKNCFPKTEILLYYGASELNYITYVTDAFMTKEKNLIGKPFPNVRVFVEKEEIYVDTPYHVEGITMPYTLSDKGVLDEEGNLYFNGRSDDIVGIRGRKVSTYRMETALMELSGIKKAGVLLLTEKEKPYLAAFVELEEVKKEEELPVRAMKNFPEKKEEKEEVFCGILDEKIWKKDLSEMLAAYEMPKMVLVMKKIPETESGKVDKKRIYHTFCEWARAEGE